MRTESVPPRYIRKIIRESIKTTCMWCQTLGAMILLENYTSYDIGSWENHVMGLGRSHNVWTLFKFDKKLTIQFKVLVLSKINRSEIRDKRFN